MKYPEKTDLHMHTTVSDGTDTPEKLIDRVKEAGITFFSVTDHDAVKGCARIARALTAEDPGFLPGVEFSCKDELGQYHILGYGYDADAAPIKRIVEKGHTFRMSKLEKRLSFLQKQFGFVFSREDRDALFSLDNPGKPHIANMMVKYGYARDKEEAIKGYLNRIASGGEYVRPEEAIAAVIASGGVPVLAHPSFGRGDELITGGEMEARLDRLTGFGLQGVEAFYSGFSEQLRDEMLGLAARRGLYVTAGSDYHGQNKQVRLGDTGLTGAEEYPEGLRRFLDRVINGKSTGGNV